MREARTPPTACAMRRWNEVSKALNSMGDGLAAPLDNEIAKSVDVILDKGVGHSLHRESFDSRP